MRPAANQLAPSSTAMAAPEVAKNPIPIASRTSTAVFIRITTMGERGGDRDGDQRDRDVGPVLDRIRRPVEQQIAQHAPADTGEHPQRRDSEQVEAFADPDSRA